MNSLHTTTPPSPPLLKLFTQPAAPLTVQWKRQPLEPQQTVQVLDFCAGDIALLEVEQGRVWVTCDGLLEDYFLEAGQRLSFTGPARLRVSAEGTQPARLIWAQQRAVEFAAYPPSPAASPAVMKVVPTLKTPGLALPCSAISAA